MGSPSRQPERFQALAIGNTYTLTPQLVNEVRAASDLTTAADVNQGKIVIKRWYRRADTREAEWIYLLRGNDRAVKSSGPPFGNILVTIDFLGDPDRDERAWDGYGYFQDDIKVTRRFTLNLGLRYERIGELGDTRGRNGNFDPALANPNPPASGTLAGYTVSSNFQGAVPAGVTKTDNNLGIPGYGQNAWEPRIGFAWQPLPHSDRIVIRSGYGIYYTRPVGAAILETTSSAPFGDLRLCEEACALAATAQNPFPPAPPISSFPLFQPYSPSTKQTGSRTRSRRGRHKLPR